MGRSKGDLGLPVRAVNVSSPVSQGVPAFIDHRVCDDECCHYMASRLAGVHLVIRIYPDDVEHLFITVADDSGCFSEPPR